MIKKWWVSFLAALLLLVGGMTLIIASSHPIDGRGSVLGAGLALLVMAGAVMHWALERME